ncbi:MAG: ATP-binding protein, partial [Myxococcota bacterium]
MTPHEFHEWAGLLPEPCALLTHDGVVVAINPFAAERGLQRGPVSAWVHPDDEPVLREILRRAVRSRALLPGRVRNVGGQAMSVRCGLLRRSPDGRQAWLLLRFADEAASEFMELTRQVQRLTAEIRLRRASEVALAAERERLLVTLRSIGDAVIAVDTAGKVQLLNPIAEQLTGWSAAEAVGRGMDEVFRIYNERTGEPAVNPVRKVLRTGVIVGLANHTALESRSGIRRSIADSAAPIRGSDGETLGVVLVFRDVTQQQRMEDELARASKLESLGVLAGGIAHDFNNILTAVVANITLAGSKLPQEHAARERLDAAKRACTRARDLTSQLLTFARGGAPVKKATALEDILRDSAAFALQGARTLAELDLEPDLWHVDADPGQVGQVLHNLVLNADQAMPDGGLIRVRVRNEIMGPSPTQPLIPGKYVRVDVEDTGPGIDPENLDKLFDPFFTTKATGTGLGLATVYSIVHRHGGHVQVENRPEGGACFSIWLPVAHEPAEEEEEVTAPTAAPAPRTGRGRVLVMDDDPTIRESAAECLAELGYEGAFAANGAEAVRMVEEAVAAGRPYAAIIMDLTVPGGMGGAEALQHIRRIDPDVRALVSSGYSQDPVVSEHRRHGFYGVLAKPWGIE